MIFWSGVLTAGLIGTAAVAVVLWRSRSAPSLSEVISRARREPVLGPEGGRTP